MDGLGWCLNWSSEREWEFCFLLSIVKVAYVEADEELQHSAGVMWALLL
jgi:hypothetical protein